MTEIREDMLKVKRMISDVEIILGKREGETELVNQLIGAQNLLTYCMSRLENAIVPPCKVGDTVYRIKYNHQLQKDIIIPFKVTEILYSSNRGVRPFIFVTDSGYRFDNCDIYPNKEIYLSKKEAEKALKEREKK